MQTSAVASLSRRSFLVASGGAAFGAVLPIRPARADAANYNLVAGSGRAHLVGAPHPETAVWSYNGAVPGPEIRLRQGERVQITVENQLAEETTVHWHGLRVPNAMDGVPHLTQRPIAPGETFVYEFDAPDAGTYWYHPHQRSYEQVGRGLYGPLIVEEREPIQVDRDADLGARRLASVARRPDQRRLRQLHGRKPQRPGRQHGHGQRPHPGDLRGARRASACACA